MNPFHASDQQFIDFISTLVPLEGDGLEHWTWEERRDFLNYQLDEGVLTIQDGRLVPNPAAAQEEEVLEDTEKQEEVIHG